MAAGLGSLHDNCIHARLLQRPRLFGRRRRSERADAGVTQRRRLDDPEGEAEHRRALVEDDFEAVLVEVRRREQVDGEGAVGRLPHLADLRPQLVGGKGPAGDGAEASGRRDRSGERRRRVARHRRLHDREADAEQFRERRLEDAQAATSL